MTSLEAGAVAPGPGALDEFVHTPARLAILSLLAPADWVTFAFLRETIATSDSALSKQLRALEEAGYVESFKDHSARRSTSVRLTAYGRRAFESYLDALEQLVKRARGAPVLDVQGRTGPGAQESGVERWP